MFPHRSWNFLTFSSNKFFENLIMKDAVVKNFLILRIALKLWFEILREPQFQLTWLMASVVYTSEILPTTYVIFYNAGKEILGWLLFTEENQWNLKPYLKSQWFLRYSPSNINWWRLFLMADSVNFRCIICYKPLER